MRENVPDIVIKPDPGVDLAKESGPEFHGSTQKNKNKIFKVLIFYMKKLKNNPIGYICCK
jgi:ribosomal protein S17E